MPKASSQSVRIAAAQMPSWMPYLVKMCIRDRTEGERFSNAVVTTDLGQTFVRRGGADVKNRCFDEHMVVERKDHSLSLIHISLPGISPTIIIMLILRIGNLMSLGHETVLLLYNPLLYETADIISTYVYRRGLVSGEYSYATAVGLVNALVSLVLITSANSISRRVTETSLW